MKMNLELEGFVSLSASEANWWKKAGPKKREAYIKKHPRSKYAQGVKSGKLSIKDKTVPKASSKSKTKASSKSIPSRPASKSKPSKSRETRAKEAVIEREENDRVETIAPGIQLDIKENFQKMTQFKSKIDKVVDSKLSPESRRNFNDFGKSFLKGEFKANKATPKQIQGGKKAVKILDSLCESILGRGRYDSIGKTVGSMIISLFVGPTNYKELTKPKDIESSSRVTRRKTPGDKWLEEITDIFDRLVGPRVALYSLSAEQEESEEEDSEYEEDDEDLEDPITNPVLERFTQAFIEWMKQLDIHALSQKMALLQARQEMIKEGYKPSKEDVESQLEDPEEPDIPPELDQLDSESSTVRPRISYRVCPRQKSIPRQERSKYDIIFDSRQIGTIESDPKIKGNGRKRRSWITKLYDGFNESAFRSGKDSSQPYTAVNSNQIVLFNPIRQTFDECRNWIKHTVDKDLL